MWNTKSIRNNPLPITPINYPCYPLYWCSSKILRVQLLIYPIPISTPDPLLVPSAFLVQLSTPPPIDWALPLWHCIRPLQPLDTLIQTIHTQKHLTICSDTSVDAAKHSSCAWTIHDNTTLWQGEGVVPGNCNDTYSSQLVAFGLLTTLLFLHHYQQHNPHLQAKHQYMLNSILW